MKIVYFLKNGVAKTEDFELRNKLRSDGNKVFFSNGSLQYGFEDSCDAIIMNDEFPLIREWANFFNIDIIESKPKQEPEEKPKQTRRTRKTADK